MKINKKQAQFLFSCLFAAICGIITAYMFGTSSWSGERVWFLTISAFFIGFGISGSAILFLTIIIDYYKYLGENNG